MVKFCKDRVPVGGLLGLLQTVPVVNGFAKLNLRKTIMPHCGKI